jgi:predicted membrane protein
MQHDFDPRASTENPVGISTNRGPSARLIGAIFLIVAGIALFLNNIGLLPIRDIWRFWPLFLIAVGIGKLLSTGTLRDRVWGMVEIFFGLLFLASNFHLFYVHFHDGTWIVGLLLVVAGFASLTGVLDPTAQAFRAHRRLRHGRWAHAHGWNAGPTSTGPASTESAIDPDGFINEEAIFGSIKRRILSDAFSGGEIQAVFGNVELDLRLASIPSGVAAVRVNSVFASVKLMVPPNWRVSVRVVGGFGSVEDKTLPLTRNDISGPTLILTGSNVFGSVEIVN